MTLLYPEYLKPHINILKPVERFFNNLINSMDRYYGELLSRAMKHKKTVVFGGIFGTLLIELIFLIFIGKESMPTVDEGQFEVSLTFPVGTRVEITDRLTKEAENIIINNLKNNLKSVFVRIEKSGSSFFRQFSEYSSRIRVRLKEKENREISQDKAIELVRKSLKNFPARVRISGSGSANMLFGMSGKPVSIEIRGEDLDIAKKIGNKIVDEITRIEGIREPDISLEEQLPELKISINRNISSKLGLNAYNIAQNISIAFGGSYVAKYRGDKGTELDILLRLREVDRINIDNILNLTIPTPVGKLVPLASIVNIEKSFSPTTINRKDNSRYITVSSDIYGRPLDKVIEDVKQTIKSKIFIPTGFNINYSGSYQQMIESFQQLILALILAVILIYAIMASQFESLIAPFVIMFAVPFGFAGSLFLLLITGKTLNIVSLIGIIVLAGIVVNNGIVLLDYMNQLLHQGMEVDKAAIEAGMRRLRPVSMTTLTTILGLIPMALGLGQGSELYSSMAISIIGGLTISTIFTLIIVPTAYAAIRKRFPIKKYED